MICYIFPAEETQSICLLERSSILNIMLLSVKTIIFLNYEPRYCMPHMIMHRTNLSMAVGVLTNLGMAIIYACWSY